MSEPDDKPADADRVIALTFRESAGELYHYLRRHTLHPDDALELAQETWERLVRTGGLKTARNKRSYLIGVAAHVWKFHLRRKIRRREIAQSFDPTESGLLPPLPEEPAEIIDREQRRSMVQAALRQLPPLQAAVLLCIRFKGLSYKDTATRCSLSIDQVTRYLSKAEGRMLVLLRRHKLQERDVQ